MAAPGPRHAGAIAGGDRPRMSGEMGSPAAFLCCGRGAPNEFQQSKYQVGGGEGGANLLERIEDTLEAPRPLLLGCRARHLMMNTSAEYTTKRSARRGGGGASSSRRSAGGRSVSKRYLFRPAPNPRRPGARCQTKTLTRGGSGGAGASKPKRRLSWVSECE